MIRCLILFSSLVFFSVMNIVTAKPKDGQGNFIPTAPPINVHTCDINASYTGYCYLSFNVTLPSTATYAVSKVIGYIKGKSVIMIARKFWQENKKFQR